MTAPKHFAIRCSILAASIIAASAPNPARLSAQAITVRDIPAPAGYALDLNGSGTVLVNAYPNPGVMTWNAATGFQDLGVSALGIGAVAINNLGHVVAYNYDGVGNNALLWTSAATGWQALIATASDGTLDRMKIPIDVNDHDDVLGEFASSRYGVLHNGTATYLPANCLPKAINNSGVTVGWCYNLTGPVYVGAGTGFVLDPVTGMRFIAGFPLAINNKGQVTGAILNGMTQQHAFFYDPAVGNVIDIGAFGGYYADMYDSWLEMSSGESINDLGQIVGHSTLSNGLDQAFVWDAFSGMKLLLPDNPGSSTARSINNRGEVVGQYYGGESRAFLATVVAPVPPTPTAQTQALENAVNALVTSGVLSTSSASQITTSLDAAVASLAKGNTNAARNQINAASNKVNALVRSHNLSAADGKKLTDSLAAIAAGI